MGGRWNATAERWRSHPLGNGLENKGSLSGHIAIPQNQMYLPSTILEITGALCNLSYKCPWNANMLISSYIILYHIPIWKSVSADTEDFFQLKTAKNYWTTWWQASPQWPTCHPCHKKCPACADWSIDCVQSVPPWPWMVIFWIFWMIWCAMIYKSWYINHDSWIFMIFA